VKQHLWTTRLARRPGNALVMIGLVLTVTGALLAKNNDTSQYGEVPGPADAIIEPATPWVAEIQSMPTPTPRVSSPRRTSSAAPSPNQMPLRLRAGAIGADAAIVPVGVRTDRSLILPPADQVGWWIGGAQPGERRGTVVLAGHVDDQDGDHGELFGLSALRPGDRIRIDSVSGRTTYQVVAMRSYPRQQLPAQLFDRTGPHRLVVLTCGGTFQPGRGYADNVVAYAEPVS